MSAASSSAGNSCDSRPVNSWANKARHSRVNSFELLAAFPWPKLGIAAVNLLEFLAALPAVNLLEFPAAFPGPRIGIAASARSSFSRRRSSCAASILRTTGRIVTSVMTPIVRVVLDDLSVGTLVFRCGKGNFRLSTHRRSYFLHLINKKPMARQCGSMQTRRSS